MCVVALFATTLATGCARFRTPDPELVGSCTRQRTRYVMPPITSSVIQDLAGPYQIVLIAQSGDKTAGVARGALVLETTDSAHRHLGPLSGRAAIDFTAVSARAMALTQSTSNEPWIMSFIDGRKNEIELTLEPQRFVSDELGERVTRVGTFLRIRQISGFDIRGSWSTGQFRENASGYFCATRTDR